MAAASSDMATSHTSNFSSSLPTKPTNGTTIVEYLSNMENSGVELPGYDGTPATDGLLYNIQQRIATGGGCQTSLYEKSIPALLSSDKSNELWSGTGKYQAGTVNVPAHANFIGTLFLANVPARLYADCEHQTIYTTVHDANMVLLEQDFAKRDGWSDAAVDAGYEPLDTTQLRRRGPSVLPPFLLTALEPYYLVRHGIAPILNLRTANTSAELQLTGIYNTANLDGWAEKVEASKTWRFVTIFFKSAPSSRHSECKLTRQELRSQADVLVSSLCSIVCHSKINKECLEVDSEAETSVLTPSPKVASAWANQVAVRLPRSKIQTASTLYGCRQTADREICIFTSKLDVARAMSKALFSGSDNMMLGHFLSKRFGAADGFQFADVVQVFAEVLGPNHAFALAAYKLGGGGELAPPILLAHGGKVVETTAEHLSRLLEGSHTAAVKIDQMDRRVTQVGLQGIEPAKLVLSEAFRLKMTTSLVHASQMSVVAVPPASEVGAIPKAAPRAAENHRLDELVEELRLKRARVQELVNDATRAAPRAAPPPGA